MFISPQLQAGKFGIVSLLVSTRIVVITGPRPFKPIETLEALIGGSWVVSLWWPASHRTHGPSSTEIMVGTSLLWCSESPILSPILGW